MPSVVKIGSWTNPPHSNSLPIPFWFAFLAKIGKSVHQLKTSNILFTMWKIRKMALSSPPKKKKPTTRCSRTSGFQEKQKEINRSPYRCEHIYSGLEKSKEKATSKQVILFLCRVSVYATQSELSVYLNMTFHSTFLSRCFTTSSKRDLWTHLAPSAVIISFQCLSV